jgi:hypothetical protein
MILEYLKIEDFLKLSDDLKNEIFQYYSGKEDWENTISDIERGKNHVKDNSQG